MNKLIARLREPSTMAGLSALALIFGVPAGVPDLVVQIGAGLAGLLAVFMPEQLKPK